MEATATTAIYTLSLHDALPISPRQPASSASSRRRRGSTGSSRRSAPSKPTSRACACKTSSTRSEEHTSELQSHSELVCRLLLEKKKRHYIQRPTSHRDTQFSQS